MEREGGERCSYTRYSLDCLAVMLIREFLISACVAREGLPARRAKPKFRIEWDLIFWMFISFAMLYFTDFASHLLFNPVVKRYALTISSNW